MHRGDEARTQGRRAAPDLAGELGEDAPLRAQEISLGLLELVVQLHHGRGLHEGRLAGAGDAVHDPETATRGHLHRDHEAPLALRHEAILKRSLPLDPLEDLVEGASDPVAELLDPPTQGAELGPGARVELALRIEGVVEHLEQLWIDLNPGNEPQQARKVLPARFGPVAEGLQRARGAAELAQFPRLEHHAATGAVHRGVDVPHSPHGDVVRAAPDLDDLLDLRVGVAHARGLTEERRLTARGGTPAGARERGEGVEDLIPVEGAERLVHRRDAIAQPAPTGAGTRACVPRLPRRPDAEYAPPRRTSRVVPAHRVRGARAHRPGRS